MATREAWRVRLHFSFDVDVISASPSSEAIVPSFADFSSSSLELSVAGAMHHSSSQHEAHFRCKNNAEMWKR